MTFDPYAAQKARLAELATRLQGHLADLKRPLIIEFAGTPKAGKSTSIAALAKFLRRHKIPVRVVIERASVCPIRDKNHPFFNVWTACTSLAQMLEALDGDQGVTILDRGIFDALVWMRLHHHNERLTDDEYRRIIDFLRIDKWLRKLDVVATLTVDAQTSLAREFKDQLIDDEGQIMNERTLEEYNDSLRACVSEYATGFKLFELDTTKLEPVHGVAQIASRVLEAAEELLDEEVAVVNVGLLTRWMPRSGVLTDPEKIARFMSELSDEVRFVKRTRAETLPNLAQPIPAAIIRQNSQILVSHIRGVKQGRLRERHAVWIGGHVRREDYPPRKTQIGATLRRCLARELEEEVGLSVPVERLPKMPAAITWDTRHPRSVQHFGLFYECRVGEHLARNIDHLHKREIAEGQWKSMYLELRDVAPSLSEVENWESWSAMYLSQAYGMHIAAKRTQEPDLFVLGSSAG
jgi:predicted NUDIX family phosphoesterase